MWEGLTGAPPERFKKPALKRHHPRTIRRNVTEDYHGCLRIDVVKGGDLYRKLEGWTEAITAGTGT
jgi:hypothetical protein